MTHIQSNLEFYRPARILDGRWSWAWRAARAMAIGLNAASGRQFGVGRLVSALAAFVPSSRLATVEGPDGSPFVIDVRDGGFGVVVTGFGTSEVQPLVDLLPEDFTVVDIGANIGVWTRVFSSRFRSGKVIAFEPSPENFELLSRNVDGKANVSCVQMAVSDSTGFVRFSAQGSRGLHHLAAQDDQDTIDVASVRLDDWLAEARVAPHLLKIDVEGFEEEVLAGATALLQTHRPAILFEFIPWLARDRSKFKGRKLMPLLAEHGYAVLRIDKSGALHRDIREEAPPDWTNDYLALIAGSPFEQLVQPLIR